MPSFIQRSSKKELLDGSSIPFDDIKRNMQELDFINRYLGGQAITIKGIKTLLTQTPAITKPISILEIGCGGGDNLRAIQQWAEKKNLPVQLTGVDINAECIAYAKQQERNAGIYFTHSDYAKLSLSAQPAIIFSSLFCHHFTQHELITQVRWMQQSSTVGFFINDLQRHPLAYYSIKMLTAVFSKSYLVKNDAPLSVLRSFIKKDWEEVFAAANIQNYSCQWQWAFRWLVTCTTHGTKI